MSFRYGQRHAHELAARGRVVAAQADRTGPSSTASSTSTSPRSAGRRSIGDGDIPKGRGRRRDRRRHPVDLRPGPQHHLPVLRPGLGRGASGANDIFIGVNALDYSGYPDCRPEFIAAFEAAANAGTRTGTEGAGYRIRTPLIDLTKAQIIERGTALGVDYGLTVTLLRPRGTPSAAGLRRVRRLHPPPAGVRTGRRRRPHPLRMSTYAVKETFRTLQGEGRQRGTGGRVPPLLPLQPVVGPRA